MSDDVYDINEGVEVAATFTDRNGGLQDPTSWKFEKRSPSGAVSSFTYPVDTALVRDSLGKFHYDLVFTESGTWIVRATSLDATIPTVIEKEYQVRKPRF